MEATRPMDSVTEISGRQNHAPAKLPKDIGPNTEQRQSVAVPGQNLPQAGKPEAGRAISGENLTAAVSRLSDYVQSIQRTLDISVHEDTGRTVVKVIDTETKEMIRQIPPDEVLTMLEHIAASIKGHPQERKGVFVQDKV